MAEISSKAVGSIENKQKFNGIELNSDFDINMYDAFYRNLDPQIGRFCQIDPKIESAHAWSPYTAMLNNPILYADPLGDSSIVPWPARVGSSTSINMFSPLLSNASASIKNDNVRVAYNKEVASLAPGDKQGRADLKEKYRGQTPEPFKSIIEQGRPMAGEQAKVNDPNFNSNATKTNAEATEAAKVGGVIGKAIVVGGLIQSGATIANSNNPVQETVTEAAGWSGAISGGTQATTYGLTVSGGNPYVGFGFGLAGSAAGFIAGKKGSNLVISLIPAMKDAIKTYNDTYPIKKPGNLIYHVR